MSPTPSLRFPRAPFAAAVLAALTLSAATSSAEPAHDADATERAQADASAYFGDPYPLATCPVSGEPLGDNPVLHVHDGRHLLFATADHVETKGRKAVPFMCLTGDLIITVAAAGAIRKGVPLPRHAGHGGKSSPHPNLRQIKASA